MVPENEFHYKEPASTANPGALQNGPGSSSKPGTATPASANTGKNEEGAAEDTGEFHVKMWKECSSMVQYMLSVTLWIKE